MKTQEFRQKVADAFVKSLTETPKTWKQSWRAVSRVPQNAVTKRKYKGVNRLWLYFRMQQLESEDPRFVTFQQAKMQGWKIKKGEKGTQVEYWFPYDLIEKKTVSWEDYADLKPEEKENYTLLAKYFTVFNAKQVEGIPELSVPEAKEISASEVVQTISKNMQVPLLHDGGNQAFYRITEDKIHLPKKEYFEDDYAYNATALHELAHATGHESRLSRDIANTFGSENYSYEELVAEMASCFMAAELPLDMSQEHFDNHQAYMQGWADGIKQQPEILMKAAKDAEKAADYLSWQGELITEKEFTEKHRGIKKAGEVSGWMVEGIDTAKSLHLQRRLEKKGYVNDYVKEFIAHYDFSQPAELKGKGVTAFLMQPLVRQGGVCKTNEECRAWIAQDPESAFVLNHAYIEGKFSEFEGITAENNPKLYSLIMMESEIFKGLMECDYVQNNWENRIRFDARCASSICDALGIPLPENVKYKKLEVKGFELE